MYIVHEDEVWNLDYESKGIFAIGPCYYLIVKSVPILLTIGPNHIKGGNKDLLTLCFVNNFNIKFEKEKDRFYLGRREIQSWSTRFKYAPKTSMIIGDAMNACADQVVNHKEK